MGEKEMKEMKLIIRSILLMKQEKLELFSEEIKYLLDICYYHIDEESKESSIKRDLENNFKIIRDELERIHKKKVEKYFEIIDNTLKNSSLDDMYLLIFIDTYRKKISKIIKELELLNQKLSQMFRDGYDQYIPKPIPSRMFSNINITSQVEQNLPKRLQALSMNENPLKKIQIIWDYSSGYNITKYPNKEDYSVIFMRMSYWYFDLPYLIPALTHELGHIASEENNIMKDLKVELSDRIANLANEDSDIDYFLRGKGLFPQQLADEIFADLLALLHHGDSYLLTLIHSFLGYHLYSSFYIKNGEINIGGEWHYNYTRDNTFLRLITLISVRDTLKSSDTTKKLFFINEDTEKAIEESKELLNKVYPIYSVSKTGESIKGYFQNWHNYQESYSNMEYVIDSFFQTIRDFLNKNKSFIFQHFENMQKNRQRVNSKLPRHFNSIWGKRFCKNLEGNLIPHQSELRKKIHFQTLNTLITEGFLTYENIEPYDLEFIKYKSSDLNEEDKEKLKLRMNAETCESILGIYDQMEIKKLSAGIPTISNYIKDIKKYSSKISLLKVLDDIEGNLTTKQEDNIRLNITIQIELKKEVKNEDIYENLYKDIESIYNFLIEKKDFFEIAEVYKSLGSKDIVVRIKGIDVKTLYKTKAHFADVFHRTFSIISYSKLTSTKNITIPKGYKFFTVLRVNGENSIKGIQEFINDNEMIINADLLSGVMDIRIEWDNEMTFSQIPKIYHELVEKNLISDMHTKLTKSLKKPIGVE
jgi:hypothetical protein